MQGALEVVQGPVQGRQRKKAWVYGREDVGGGRQARRVDDKADLGDPAVFE